MNEEEFEKKMEETRAGHEQLHWYIAGFALTILTLLFNFIKEIASIVDPLTVILIKISVWSLVAIIILSPLTNLLSHIITSLFAQTKREWDTNKREGVRLHNKAAFLTKIRFATKYISMGLCVVVLILLAIGVSRLYLN
ncbi:MAG: hypothetical protein WCW78_00930 [Candidatus Paceibacterota bacterium]|jgi:hypothetical protein